MSPDGPLGNEGLEFGPDRQLFVDDILDSTKSPNAFEQDRRDASREASKTVLAELGARGVASIAELQERVAELEALGGEHGSPLLRIARQYFTAYGTLPAGSKEGDYEYLGCLSEAVHCIAIAHNTPGDYEIEDAYDKVMEYAQELGSNTHNTLRGYIDELAGH